MSKRILLIDSDEAFAQGLSNAMTSRGFDAVMATNSEQGMTLARQDSPDLIVVCVEAQPTNGYMLCTRLKKDEALKGIPVILTSANATQDSFEKHKKLKTRAEEYLIKPFAPQVMLEKASALLGVPLPAEEGEEILTMEDEPLGLGDLVPGEDEPIHLTEHDAQQAHTGEIRLAEEPVEVVDVEEVMSVEEHPADHDDDLKMFDQAFDSLGAHAAAASDSTERFSGLRLAPEPETGSPPPHEEPREALHEAREHEHGGHSSHDEPRGEGESQPTELTAPDDDAVLHGLLNDGAAEPQHEGPSALEARVAELEQQLAEREAELEVAKRSASSAGELQRLKEAKNRNDKELLRLKEELHAKEKELLDLQEAQTSLEGQSQQLRDDAVKREAAAKALQQRADALAAAAKKFERELTSAREELKQGAALKARLGELEKSHAELGRAQDELQKKHADAAAEADRHRTRADQLAAELAGTTEVHAEAIETARAEADKARADHAALEERSRKGETELAQHKDELETARHELAGVRAELETLRAELETVRTDVTALTGEKDLLGEERDELRRQLADEKQRAAQNEERAVRAYQKIKGDEKLREKTRKALQIALQLLEEGAESSEAEPAKQSA